MPRRAQTAFLLLGLVLACTDESTPEKPGPGTGRVTVERAGKGKPELGGLAKIRKRGTLRVLIATTGERFLPRAGTPDSTTRKWIIEFARRQKLNVRFVLVDAFRELIPRLERGEGDLIAAQLTVTPARARRVAFTRPTATVSEVLVGRKGEKKLPRSVKELAGREVLVRPRSSFAATLRALARKYPPGPRIVAADPRLDTERLVYQVTQGDWPLTVADSHTLAAIETYNPKVKPLFPIAEGKKIAWAVRRENARLKAALDAFLVEKALVGPPRARFTGDLAHIRKRGVLRVLTRNNPVTYFLYRGRQRGFDFELARMMARELGVRLEMVVPPRRDQLIPWLLEGRGDVIAASLTITARRAARVAFSRPYLWVREMLVQSTRTKRARSLADLEGEEIYVRASSSYHDTLRRLQRQGADFDLVAAPEDEETEQIIDRVEDGEIPYTVADSHLLAVERAYGAPIVGAFPLEKRRKPIAFALRPTNPQLRRFLDAFVKRTYRGTRYNLLRRRYFESKRSIAEAKESRVGASGRLSPYDAIIRRIAASYGLDWRLLAAQAYQESRFDPRAHSWAGARGLFQLLPSTARSLGVTDLLDPEQSAQAGAKYLNYLLRRFDPRIPLRQRIWFGLAAYNAGPGHVFDAQRLAEERGLDSRRWFDNVERTMLLLRRPRFYRRARHGYCRGKEPVRYVRQIRARYRSYVKLVRQ